MNKGVVGRGKSLINARQIEKLKSLATILGYKNQELLGFEIPNKNLW